MKTKFIYDLILPYFVGDDDLRPALKKVHGDDNGFIYATDCHILIRVPKEKVGKEYLPVEKYPNAESMFKDAFEREGNDASTILTSDLIEVLASIAWRRSTGKSNCSECDGTGYKYCEHCDNDYDCKECNGTGKIDEGIKEFSLLISEENHYSIKIGKSAYGATYLQIIAIASQMLGSDKIKYTHKDKDKSGLFSFADIDIILMPYLSDGNITLKIFKL